MNALSLQNVSKSYKSGILALKSINLEVAAGDFFALLGANGAGKTTLIGIISSLNVASSGKVFIFDQDIERHPLAAKRQLGVVPQEFNLNIFDSIEKILIQQAGYYGVPRDVAETRLEYYLKALDLWHKRHTEIRRLSGGMKRRVMIARALIHEPKLLLLDEPTAGVDIELRYQMWEFLKKINQQQGTTIILTTHYLEEAEELCHNLAIIDHGELIAKSSMANLLHQLTVEVFVLHTRENLAGLPALSFAGQLVNEKTLEVTVPKERSINELFVELSRHGLTVVSMESKMSRLENLFLTLTGKNE